MVKSEIYDKSIQLFVFFWLCGANFNLILMFQTIKECTADMDSDTWNAYHIVSNRARSVCYVTRQQLFRRRAENTVNALISTATSQLDAMKDLQVDFFGLFIFMCTECRLILLWSWCFITGGPAGAEGADCSLPGQAAGRSQRSAGPTGETVWGPGANGEFTEGQPGASGPGESPHRLWAGTGSSAYPGHYKENGWEYIKSTIILTLNNKTC